MKKCTICGEEKEFDYFYRNKKSKDGHESRCKICASNYKKQNKDHVKKYHKEYYKKNKKSKIEYQKDYANKNKDRIKEYLKDYSKNYREDNKEDIKKRQKDYSKKYYKINRGRIIEYSKKYQKENIEDRKEYSKKYRKLNKIKRSNRHKERMKSDVSYRLKYIIRNLIRRSLERSGYTKKSRTHEILGCSFKDFKLYLESKFENWMNWGNKGLYNGKFNYGWDIDHITPQSSATSEEEIIKLNHYTNFQPLCSKINRDIKNDRLDYV